MCSAMELTLIYNAAMSLTRVVLLVMAVIVVITVVRIILATRR